MKNILPFLIYVNIAKYCDIVTENILNMYIIRIVKEVILWNTFTI